MSCFRNLWVRCKHLSRNLCVRSTKFQPSSHVASQPCAIRRPPHKQPLRISSNRATPNPGIYIYLERSEEHTSELQSLMRISYAVFCLKKKKIQVEKQQQRSRQDKIGEEA